MKKYQPLGKGPSKKFQPLGKGPPRPRLAPRPPARPLQSKFMQNRRPASPEPTQLHDTLILEAPPPRAPAPSRSEAAPVAPRPPVPPSAGDSNYGRDSGT